MRASLVLALVAGTALAPAVVLGAPSPAPTPASSSGPVDHMQAVTASPLKRIRLTGIVGRVVNITFNPKEAIYRVAFGTAGIWEGPQAGGNGQAVALKNNLPLWPVQPGHTNLVVTTVDADGHEYPYQFDLTALPAPSEAPAVTASLASTGTVARSDGAVGEDVSGATFGLIVKNSEAERAEQAEKARAAHEARMVQWQQRQAAAHQAQARASLAESGAAGDPGPNCNPHYVGWGSAAIAPVSVCDNGQMTFLRYQGQLRPPSVFVLGPDGKEQALIPFMRGDTLVVPRVAKEMHLYSGQTALYIFNRAYNPAGVSPVTGGVADPGTGTVSPGVRRVLRSTGNAR